MVADGPDAEAVGSTAPSGAGISTGQNPQESRRESQYRSNIKRLNPAESKLEKHAVAFEL